MKKKFALAAIATLLLAVAPAVSASASTPGGGGGPCTDHVKVASSATGLIWGTTAKVTNNTCGDRVRSFVRCNSFGDPIYYGNTVVGNGTTTISCNGDPRTEYGYDIDKGSGWVEHVVGQ